MKTSIRTSFLLFILKFTLFFSFSFFPCLRISLAVLTPEETQTIKDAKKTIQYLNIEISTAEDQLQELREKLRLSEKKNPGGSFTSDCLRETIAQSEEDLCSLMKRKEIQKLIIHKIVHPVHPAVQGTSQKSCGDLEALSSEEQVQITKKDRSQDVGTDCLPTFSESRKNRVIGRRQPEPSTPSTLLLPEISERERTLIERRERHAFSHYLDQLGERHEHEKRLKIHVERLTRDLLKDEESTRLAIESTEKKRRDEISGTNSDRGLCGLPFLGGSASFRPKHVNGPYCPTPHRGNPCLTASDWTWHRFTSAASDIKDAIEQKIVDKFHNSQLGRKEEEQEKKDALIIKKLVVEARCLQALDKQKAEEKKTRKAERLR